MRPELDENPELDEPELNEDQNWMRSRDLDEKPELNEIRID